MGAQDAGPHKEAATWIEVYRRFWEGSMDWLEKYLRQVEAAKTKSKMNGAEKNNSTASSKGLRT